ncbi:MAG: hypothetical protein HQ508_08475 [Candidatus Marinimicrobia bacterium]|nr:hypothetical protein [Candidatus Neomarinimicrobiota bacterium]
MNLSYQEKSIWLSLGSTILIFAYYFFRVTHEIGQADMDENAILRLFISVMILIVSIEIVSQSIIAGIFHKDASKSGDERVTLIKLKASRISYLFLVFGIWVTGLSLFLDLSALILVNIMMFFFILAEVIGCITQLIYHQRGV